jgi:hypothetical protein
MAPLLRRVNTFCALLRAAAAALSCLQARKQFAATCAGHNSIVNHARAGSMLPMSHTTPLFDTC